MPQESPNNGNNKPKQRFNGRQRSYVDSFRWGFVPEEESEHDAVNSAASNSTAPKRTASKPEVKQPNTERKNISISSDVSHSNNANPAKRKRTPKKTAKVTSESVVKPESKTPVPQPASGKRTSKSRKRSKLVQPKYVTSPTFDEDDEDLKLPSYGRTPIPTDDELPVPRKIVKKPEPKRTTLVPAKSSAENLLAEPVVAAVSSSGFHPRREQMVWDPDKSEYVPLVETPKSEPSISKKQPKPERRKERSETVSEKMPEKPVKKPAKISPERPQPQKSSAKSAHTSQLDRLDRRKHRETEPTEAQRKEEREPKKQHQPQADTRRSQVSRYVEPPQLDPTDVEAEVSGFAELGVSDVMLEALKIVRYLEPTPIQAGVFQKVQAGVDLMGQAQTGTGKTAAFSMPIIEGVELCPPGNSPVALILVPTRELAVQVRDEAMRLAYGRDIRITACYGGKPLAKQIERLKTGIDILVGTPGRILDLMNRRALSLGSLRWVVLDEADRMLDIGFRPDIEKILRQTPSERQTLLFSATLPPPVVRLAEKYMKSPEVLDFSNKSVAVDTIDQFYITVDPERKFDALVYLLEEQQPRQAIIFTRTKRGADRLARLLSNRFENLAAIHGDLAQSERDRVMAQVRSGSLRYLVATDVVGRGIDVSGISHIINYDVPKFCDDYVHRVGRTGRMGREGIAFTFVTVQEGSELTRIEMRIDKLLKRAELKGFESFTKPHDPSATLEDEMPPEPAKPVFGKPIRKVRRAL